MKMCFIFCLYFKEIYIIDRVVDFFSIYVNTYIFTFSNAKKGEGTISAFILQKKIEF